ncbi:uncharacterized protein PV07_11644 [Cladophialophora immunda]|uniref:Major facilitator superfamily (MFS) profile domain-containing protein n=1 Tax=Cladophialophora immunda TaxID=569365 RepID=A0A0D2BYN7_9EURO|nr:uncharacterized protein PV07_11644 [Cladophialophora immunda]KIW23450.1 hypothetical protein PV07_11644 [Cladophialophora immunda]
MSQAHVEDASYDLERKRHFKAYTVFICIFMSFGSLGFGMAAAVIATLLGQPTFVSAMQLDGPHAQSLEGCMNSLFYVGGIFGSFNHGWMANRFGRKLSITFGAVMLLVSQALLTGSVHPAMFIVFRFFSGWGGFQIVCGVPLWIGEIVPPKNRGMLSDIHAIFINTGYLINGVSAIGYYYYQSPDAWRLSLGITMVPPTLLLCGIYWLPESPRYLISTDRHEEAWSVIHRLHSDPRDPDDTFATREFLQIYKQIQLDKSLKGGYAEIFRRPSYRKRAIINYGVTLYKGLGYTGVKSLAFSAGYIGQSWITSVLAMTYVDRVKRNYLISAGFFMSMVSLIVYTGLIATYLESDNRNAKAAAVSMLFLYISSFELFLDGPEFFYITEIWPSHLRAQGFALGMAVYSGINLCWLQAAPTAFANIGWRFYILFIFFAALGGVLSFFYYPDTLHKPLEEIAAIFGDDDLVVLYQRDLVGQESQKLSLEAIIGDGSKDSGSDIPEIKEIVNKA